MSRRKGALGALALAAALAAARPAAAEPPGPVAPAPGAATAERLAGMTGQGVGRRLVVGPGGAYPDLGAAIDVARDGDIVEVRGGRRHGPFLVRPRVVLVGVGRPVLDGGGAGTVVTFETGGGLEGFDVRDSGTRSDREDAGVTSRGPIVVVGNGFEDVLYGVDLQTAPGSVVARNTIVGRDLEMPRRGDAIRVWESPGTRVEANDVRRARDLVVWYSTGVTVRGNRVRDSRYGVHFMYASGSHVEDNRFEHNAVGAFAMYSSDLVYLRNVFAANHGPSGYGIALKDSDGVIIRDNVLAGNRTGLYFDNSPSRPGVTNEIEGNTIAYNDVGVAFLPSVRGNRLGSNSFVENFQQVAVLAGGSFGGNDWTPGGRGNYWSTYTGYDADGDGRGDVAFREVSLFGDLLAREPALRLFLFSPAQTAIELSARAFPVFQPAPVLTDTAPRMTPLRPMVAAPIVAPWPLLAMASALVALAMGTAAWGMRLDAGRGDETAPVQILEGAA